MGSGLLPHLCRRQGSSTAGDDELTTAAIQRLVVAKSEASDKGTPPRECPGLGCVECGSMAPPEERDEAARHRSRGGVHPPSHNLHVLLSPPVDGKNPASWGSGDSMAQLATWSRCKGATSIDGPRRLLPSKVLFGKDLKDGEGRAGGDGGASGVASDSPETAPWQRSAPLRGEFPGAARWLPVVGAS